MQKTKKYQPYLEVLEPLLRSFREEILKYFGKVDIDRKNDYTIVTHIDQEVEEKIREVLAYKFPEIGFHGEEFGKSGSEETYWLIDPIDGTENFVRGIDGIGTMIALIENGRPELAVIYNPIADELYWAIDGEGAYKEGVRLRLSDRESKASFLEVDAMRTPELHYKILEFVNDKKIKTLQMHGCAWRAWLLAESKIDGCVRIKGAGKDWDYVPHSLLAKEAGMNFFDLDGKGLFARSFALLNDSLSAELSDFLKTLVQK